MDCSSDTILHRTKDISTVPSIIGERAPLIIVVEDGCRLSQAIHELCEFLDIEVEHMDSEDDLTAVLEARKPMAVMAEIDAAGQDGCHVMKTVAYYDPNLPILLLTGNDPAMAGAVDAVEEVWGLSAVTKRAVLPRPGEIVDFLFRAGQRGRCLGLMPA